MATELGRESVEEQFRRFIAECRSPVIRTMAEFAEQEIVIPDGPFEGLKFRMDRQPYTRLLYEAIDSGNWNRFVITGPTQSGKTLSACIVPIMYHLFEMRETVIFAMPNMDMAGDKWNEDLRPAIEASRYRDLLPTTGQGSRSASKLDAVRFKNGATLKFMSGGGSDKKRAAFTSRVVVITETDGMDEQGGNSREADKITQIEARTRAYGDRKRIYMECTVSIEEGRTWREYNSGTRSKILLPCPHCREWVTPEREHLVGWHHCIDSVEAKEKGHFACPACAAKWSDKDRENANNRAAILHRGQELSNGKITGEPSPTSTLGFRWSAVHNNFLTPGYIAEGEWHASRSANEDNAEREQRQFVWAIPYVPQKQDITDLDERILCERQSVLPRGICPDDREFVTIGADVGKYRIHWTAVAWQSDQSGLILDYGTIETGAKDNYVETAVLKALRTLRDLGDAGFTTPQGEIVPVDHAWVDAHWLTKTVKGFCRESGIKWQPSIGFGVNQYSEGGKRKNAYNAPKTTGATVWKIGENYHAARIPGETGVTWEFNADFAKLKLHDVLACPPEEEGAVRLFKVDSPIEHQRFVRHLLSEKMVEEFVDGKGIQIKWETHRSTNHWFDACVLARLAAHAYQRFVRRASPVAKAAPVQHQQPGQFLTPGGQAFFATAR